MFLEMYNKGDFNDYQQELAFMKKRDFFEMENTKKQNYQPNIESKFDEAFNQPKFQKHDTPEFDEQRNQDFNKQSQLNEREQFFKKFDEKFQNKDDFMDQPEHIPQTDINRTTSYSYSRGDKFDNFNQPDQMPFGDVNRTTTYSYSRGGTPFTYQADFPPRQMSNSINDNGTNRTTSYSYTTSNHPGEFRDSNFRSDFDRNVDDIKSKFSHYNQGPQIDPHEKFQRQNLEYSQPYQPPRNQSTHTSKKVSKNTTIKNGKKVTVTTTEITNPDGTTTYEKYEETDDGNGNVTVRKYNDRY